MKILVEGKNYKDMMYRVRCPYCHGVFEGTAEEISREDGSLRIIKCPCCDGRFRAFQADGETLNRDIIRCLDTSLDDFDDPKKIRLQTKENI